MNENYDLGVVNTNLANLSIAEQPMRAKAYQVDAVIGRN